MPPPLSAGVSKEVSVSTLTAMPPPTRSSTQPTINIGSHPASSTTSSSLYSTLS